VGIEPPAAAHMPNLRDFERRLGGLVEGLFSKTFRSGVQPVEIAKRVVRAMDDGKQVAVNEVWAPNRFEISLSNDDAPRFQQIEPALVKELSGVVLETAGERGWGLVGPPEVELFVDNKLKRGDLVVEASLVQGEEPVEVPAPVAATPPRTAQLRVHEEGGVRAIPLDKELVTIGRQSACDVVVPDTGASRRHAQVRTLDGVSTLTDLGSTNGTKVNGRDVQSATLQDGDTITIGTTQIEYRSA
jgi:FhaA, N-terminal domain/FHA domain